MQNVWEHSRRKAVAKSAAAARLEKLSIYESQLKKLEALSAEIIAKKEARLSLSLVDSMRLLREKKGAATSESIQQWNRRKGEEHSAVLDNVKKETSLLSDLSGLAEVIPEELYPRCRVLLNKHMSQIQVATIEYTRNTGYEIFAIQKS